MVVANRRVANAISLAIRVQTFCCRSTCSQPLELVQEGVIQGARAENRNAIEAAREPDDVEPPFRLAMYLLGCFLRRTLFCATEHKKTGPARHQHQHGRSEAADAIMLNKAFAAVRRSMDIIKIRWLLLTLHVNAPDALPTHWT